MDLRILVLITPAKRSLRNERCQLTDQILIVTRDDLAYCRCLHSSLLDMTGTETSDGSHGVAGKPVITAIQCRMNWRFFPITY